MAIKITVSNLVKFKVRGTIKDEQGIDQPFDFSLVCERRKTDQLKDLLENSSNQTVLEFMTSVINDWDGVRDAEGKPIPYSEDNLRALFQIPGVGALAFRTYFDETSARAKN